MFRNLFQYVVLEFIFFFIACDDFFFAEIEKEKKQQN